MDTEIWMRVAYLGLILTALGGWLMVEFRQRLGQSLRYALAWGLIFLGMAGGYGVWQDIRGSSALRQTIGEGGEITLRRADDGHFYLRLTVDGVEVPFMIDTGATNIVLDNRAAADLGINTQDLMYLGSASTANGTVRTARVTLDKVTLGPFTDTDVRAFVTDGEMEGSLLGMDYLRRFRLQIEGDRMILSR